MEADILKTIVHCTANYFKVVAGGGAVIGTPYLRNPDEAVTLDYSAVIGITGAYRGSVYYSAPTTMLDTILPLMGEKSPEERLRADLIGEITNIIAGNVRKQLGAGFMISPPFLLQGRAANVQSFGAAPCYVIPVDWREHRSCLLVTLSAEEPSK